MSVHREGRQELDFDDAEWPHVTKLDEDGGLYDREMNVEGWCTVDFAASGDRRLLLLEMKDYRGSEPDHVGEMTTLAQWVAQKAYGALAVTSVLARRGTSAQTASRHHNDSVVAGRRAVVAVCLEAGPAFVSTGHRVRLMKQIEKLVAWLGGGTEIIVFSEADAAAKRALGVEIRSTQPVQTRTAPGVPHQRRR